VPPSHNTGKPCLAEHHQQDAAVEKDGEGSGCNFSFSFEGLNASFSEFGSELQKFITNHKKIVKMQTQMFWNHYTEIYKFCYTQIFRNHAHFNL